VVRNIAWAVERVNARGGVKTAQGKRPMVLERYDSKGQSEEALSALKSAIDDGAQVMLQGNSSANAAALDRRHQQTQRARARQARAVPQLLGGGPGLTNEKCSFWHFRFDAHADMRMTALMQVLREDKTVKSVYLIGQDYSFGQAVLREAKRQLADSARCEGGGRRAAPHGPGQRLFALCRQDQGQRSASRHHRQLGQ
jgi:branched-chain amino acid transport system substrate-binding protein